MVIGVVLGNYVKDQITSYVLLRDLRASLEQKQNVVGVPVAKPEPIKRDPVFQWVTSRDDTRAVPVAGIMSFGPFSPDAIAYVRIEITADHPVNAGYLPTMIRDDLHKLPGVMETEWRYAFCPEHGMLHGTVACHIPPPVKHEDCAADSRGCWDLVIQDSRPPITPGSLLQAAIAHRVLGSEQSADASTENHVQIKVSTYTCVKNCEQHQ